MSKIATDFVDLSAPPRRPIPHQPMNRQEYTTATLASSAVTLERQSPDFAGPVLGSANKSGDAPHTGLLIINADDWGVHREATDRTLDCFLRKTISSASAMVFMEDSERAAQLALETGVDTGLHLNLTAPFSAPGCPTSLSKHHHKVARYLTRDRFAKAMYHPGLRQSFEVVVSAQLDEYRRLYREDPRRVDGHHHMHLCANVLLGGLLPAGTIARRNYSFLPGQKSSLNRIYRKTTDRILARRHRLADFFFPLPPLEPASRLEGILNLARQFVVEVESHPEDVPDYRFLAEIEMYAHSADLTIAPRYALSRLDCL
jgi:hypothetical protein